MQELGLGVVGWIWTWNAPWIQRDGKIQPLKTKCVFFPPPQYFDKRKQLLHWRMEQKTQTEMTIASKWSKESEKTNMSREDACYDIIDKTQLINLKGIQTYYTKHFKIPWILYLTASNSKQQQTTTMTSSPATQQPPKRLGPWPNLGTTSIDTYSYSKYLIFWAIPMNLLLWGCEAWSLQQSLQDKLEVFLTQNVQQILCISMYQVKKERITNNQVRKQFYNRPCVKNMIAARLLSFIGKAVQDPHQLQPTKLMLTTSCCNNSRKRGRPYTTNKDTIVNCLVLLFDCVPEVTIDESRIHDRLGKGSQSQQQREILEVAHSMLA
jgi:hypothetical protein